ncbi:type IV conjugative transfer system protein TraL [Desulfurivibrio sp. D14AmB]|uniref:type IV conjugative transfer system protein TraL n=1 Tax=Desulfurivibrio sp. D14AmB TaxID=3374370 RepID=UPI00376F203C
MQNLSRPFPQYLSKPIQVLWFEPDDMVVIMSTFVLGLVYGGVAWLAVLAGPPLFIHLKKSKPRGYLIHLLYVVGLLRMKGYPAYFEKEFHE